MPSIHFDNENAEQESNKGTGLSGDSVFDNKSESEIWKEFKNHNESAFIFIYSKFFKPLFQYASQFTSDKELIKDAIQDLFIELRKNRANLSETNSIKGYLFKSIRRKVLYYKGRHNTVDFKNEEVGYHFSFVLSHEHKLIERQLKTEKLKHLNLALTHITSRQREAVYHFFYEGMSYAHIADVMELNNVKSARNLIYKALQLIKEEMKKAST